MGCDQERDRKSRGGDDLLLTNQSHSGTDCRITVPYAISLVYRLFLDRWPLGGNADHRDHHDCFTQVTVITVHPVLVITVPGSVGAEGAFTRESLELRESYSWRNFTGNVPWFLISPANDNSSCGGKGACVQVWCISATSTGNTIKCKCTWVFCWTTLHKHACKSQPSLGKMVGCSPSADVRRNTAVVILDR